jgi:hypothetical protein
MKSLLYWFLTLLCFIVALGAFYLVVYEINTIAGMLLSVFGLALVCVIGGAVR